MLTSGSPFRPATVSSLLVGSGSKYVRDVPHIHLLTGADNESLCTVADANHQPASFRRLGRRRPSLVPRHLRRETDRLGMIHHPHSHHTSRTCPQCEG